MSHRDLFSRIDAAAGCRLVALFIAVGLVWAGATPVFAADAERKDDPVQFLFIHHSCGGQLLADCGEQVGGERDSGERCIYQSHPNGGGLRARLEQAGYAVNEASYGSLVGADTDIHHWRKKFTDQMDLILTTQRQDQRLPEGVTNRIVAFKSCYPNNAFVGRGAAPGNPDAAELTVTNAQAAYTSLLPRFAEHPEVLFIAFTAPPQAEPKPQGFKAKLKALFKGKPKRADLAREFNTWLADTESGWLAGYQGGNVVVFDYYDILTDGGATNWSAYPTGDGTNSHPSATGNGKAADAFVTFIDAAVADWSAATGVEPR